MLSPGADISLRNVGPGPDPFMLGHEPADASIVLVVFHRDYYCRTCRRQVQRIADRYDEFEARGAVVVSVLPESRARTREWHERLDLPFPVLADPEGVAADAFGQPVRFGKLGELSDLLGRMPLTVVMTRTDGTFETIDAIPGSTPFDRPSVDELLAIVDRVQGIPPSSMPNQEPGTN